jgi:hypothetical protein
MQLDEKQWAPPPSGVRWVIRVARLGEFQDEYEDFFLLAYQHKCQKKGEKHARRWSYWFATKTAFFAVVEWAKLAFILYLKISGG